MRKIINKLRQVLISLYGTLAVNIYNYMGITQEYKNQ